MTGHRILIVEDSPDLALAVSTELEEHGFNVSHVATGAEALDAISTELPELAILDMQLPDTTGIALCEQIRRSHSFPLIMFSGVNSEAPVIEAIQRGATDYVLKGSGLAELVARVNQHLGVKSSDAAVADSGQPSTPGDPGDSRTLVLVVDGDPAAQAQLVELLTAAECRVITAPTDAEAIQIVQSQRPPVLVVSLDAPGSGGLKLVQSIRSSVGGAKRPGIIGVSRRLSPEAVRRGRYHGIAAFITRPWNPSRIHLEIRHAIDAALKAGKRAA